MGSIGNVARAAAPEPQDELSEILVQAPEPRFVAPTHRDQIGRIWAPVWINGKGPFRLVLDTGANHSGITGQVAELLGIPLDQSPPVLLRGVTGITTVPTIRVDSFTVGGGVTITRTARDCTKTGDQIVARIGILGRVISGPAGSPATVEVPIRVAVVQGGIQERTITTKVYRTTVSMSAAGNDPFSLVAEDIVYPVPSPATVDSYIFYIGFDPQALGPEPKASKRKKN